MKTVTCFGVEDALLWIDAGGVARVTELTRIGLAKVLEGDRLHPTEAPGEVLGRFARANTAQQFEYSEDGTLCVVETDLFALFGTGAPPRQTATRTCHLAVLDAYGFRGWPDARLFRFIEFLVHPTIRQGDEQAALVNALNGVLSTDRFELTSDEQVSGHPVFNVRSVRTGVAGRPKNLIFASTGPKPELGFVDA